MANLVLIRHAETQRVPGVNAHDWQLTEEGQQRCLLLAERLLPFALHAVITSPEPKALQTARPVAERYHIPLTTLDGLREHDRRNIQYLGDDVDFKATIRRLFEQPGQLVYGNETADQAHQRVASAIHQAVEQQPDRNLALVSHATVLTLFISRVVSLDPFTFWSQLGMPAYIMLDLPSWSIREIVSAL